MPEHREQYAAEIKDICHDIEAMLSVEWKDGGIAIGADFLRAVVVLAQFNLHIWQNESKCRNGEAGSNLALSHSLNGRRIEAKNIINDVAGGPQDRKVDCLAAEFQDWQVSW